MEQITIRLPEDLLDDLETEAEEADVSRSEYIRDALRTREDTERLRERLESREDRIDELERQLAERSQIEDKIENLPDKIRGDLSYQERRQRKLDEASIPQRVKWLISGVPVSDDTE
jgi:Arc/MetJ-type ribon-helix-helix transcriptional regulator